MTSLAIPNSATSNSAAASTTAFSGSAAATGTGSAASLTQSDFLQLLTAQLKYQNPSSPADSTQLTSEFAAITEVDGINQLNTQVSNIQSSGAAGQMAQAAALVGKQVAVPGDMLSANAAGSAHGAFNLSSAAANVNVTVIAPNGTVADTLKLGALAAGQQNFSFAGASPNTQYTYNVTASGASGSAVATTPYSVYTVQGVNVSGTAPTLNVAGNATPIPVSSIQTVLGGTSS
jgi:flagellar basal-body rod modification protein FlgD